jgi:hypothetical protein
VKARIWRTDLERAQALYRRLFGPRPITGWRRRRMASAELSMYLQEMDPSQRVKYYAFVSDTIRKKSVEKR